MEKYGNKSPLMKFLHKNTGFIVCGVILSVAIPLYFYEVNSQEFFEQWPCSTLQWYVLSYNQDIHNRDFPDHDHMTEQQHEKFHQIITECDFVFEHK